MSLLSDAAGVTANPGLSKGVGTHLHGRRRVLVSIGVGVVALLSLGTFVVRLSAFAIHVQTACAGLPCAYGQLTYS
jgi:hypothetical protein